MKVCSLAVSTTAAFSFCLSVCTLKTSLSGAERQSKHVRSFRAAVAARFQHLTTLLSGKNRNNCPISFFWDRCAASGDFNETRTDSCHGDVLLFTPAGTSRRCRLDRIYCVFTVSFVCFCILGRKRFFYTLTGFQLLNKVLNSLSESFCLTWGDFNMMENNKSSNDRVMTDNTAETTVGR